MRLPFDYSAFSSIEPKRIASCHRQRVLSRCLGALPLETIVRNTIMEAGFEYSVFSLMAVAEIALRNYQREFRYRETNISWN
jgi:hypothetical protein